MPSHDLLTPVTVKSLANSLTAENLAGCVCDAIRWKATGNLPEGSLHAFADRLEAEVGFDEMTALHQAESAVLREAAIRFATLVTGVRADQ